jgi:hypothetical protein
MRMSNMAIVEKNQTLASKQALPAEWRYLEELETCEELKQAILLTCKRLGVRAGPSQRRIEEDLKLQYYFGGKDVAYLPSDRGRIVVAAGRIGSDRFTEALERVDPRQRCRLLFCSPVPWNESASLLPI